MVEQPKTAKLATKPEKKAEKKDRAEAKIEKKDTLAIKSEKKHEVDGDPERIIEKPAKEVLTPKAEKSIEAVKLKKGMIAVKQIGSPIRRDPRQRLYLRSLGLGKMNQVRHVIDNPSTRGLLAKLQHMVIIVDGF